MERQTEKFKEKQKERQKKIPTLRQMKKTGKDGRKYRMNPGNHFKLVKWKYKFTIISSIFSVKSPNDVQNKEVIVGVVTDVDLLHYVTQNEGLKLNSISESNSVHSNNSGKSSPENLDQNF